MSGTKPSNSKLVYMFANGGRPNNTGEMVRIVKACEAMGLAPMLARAVACFAYDARYTFQIMATARSVERIAREDHIDRCPNGQWARLTRYHGACALYFDELTDWQAIRMWSSLPGPREAIVADFE